ncbi:DUF4824 family protein [Metapseudomonas resinovorans]|uniref:DUF4824 domain-containing protein n=1 Tax=Metapseudomonas resinovorans NBRC 106553 TaxID=1245471 RepID=S6AV33_METRE|nr:DUF4824 family protein [Pseudomonas resinovorans]BAN50043.1 hypothetical protein PCA10_43110 [Pseudomonas resinovorans NBRC 106553]
MKNRTALLGGLALIGLTNAIALGGVWYNRSGEADSRLLLSEREVRRSYDWADHENSGLALRLDWRRPSAATGDDPYQSLMLDQDSLLQLGFSATDRETLRFDNRNREVLVVLELDGPARVAELERARQRLAKARSELRSAPQDKSRQEAERAARNYVEQEEHRSSRLFAVDVGLDREALRSRYPDRGRYAILSGIVSAWVRDGRLTGQISRLRIAEINVPHAWREGLRDGLVRDREDKPSARLRLWLSIGQRLEPWIDSVPELQRGDGQGKPASADSLASSTRP